MKKRNTTTVVELCVLIVILLIITSLLFFNKEYSYALISFVAFIISTIFFIVYFKKTKTKESIYKNKLNNYLKSYYSLLSEMNSIPYLKDKDIVKLSEFDDLLNVQEEVKKPIFYMVHNNSTSFLIIDDKLVCLYVLKMYNYVKNPFEIIMDENKRYAYLSDDKKLLEKLENTAIIRLDNSRLVKVSPIKKVSEIPKS